MQINQKWKRLPFLFISERHISFLFQKSTYCPAMLSPELFALYFLNRIWAQLSHVSVFDKLLRDRKLLRGDRILVDVAEIYFVKGIRLDPERT